MVQVKNIIYGIGLLLASFSHANTSHDQALGALAAGDYQLAASLWQALANEGDARAQYNLALLYKEGAGVNPDGNLTVYWLSMAARQGLVEAYSRLNQQSVVPSTQSLPTPLSLSPEDWVAQQNPRYYTLQLASSTNRQLIIKYYEENDLAGRAGYYRSLREGEEWFVLVYGAFASVQEAKAAIDTLPSDLKKWSPWVRNVKTIHKVMIR